MYGTEGIVERLVEVMNGVWRGEGFPVDWREGVICPIYKKGEKSKVPRNNSAKHMVFVCVNFERKR
jgi:hypothetical protein